MDEAVSKMEEKSQANADNKENIRNSTYAAAANAEGAYLTSRHQRNIADASRKLLEAQAVLQFFLVELPVIDVIKLNMYSFTIY
jgi:hypothetical protein